MSRSGGQAETLETATQAFQQFAQGLATGEWEPFLNQLTDDFTFWFPVGPFQGVNVGKPRAAEFFQYVFEAFKPGLTVAIDGVTSNETTVVFELRSEGFFKGHPYKNRVAVCFDVRDHKICGYREYLNNITV